MTTTYKSPQGPQEPEQTPQVIKVSKVVRRSVPSNGQTPVGDNAARSLRSTPTARPFLPSPPLQQNDHLQPTPLAAKKVDFLPTLALPAQNNDLAMQAEQSVPPPVTQYPAQNQYGSAASNNPQIGNSATQLNQQQLQQPASPVLPAQPKSTHRIGQEPEIGDGHIILHRGANFYVRTTNSIGQRQNPLRRRSGHTTLLPKIAPEQEKRVVASETRLMPKIAPINPAPAQAFPVPKWIEAFIVITGLLAALAAHAYNMFYYPQYGLDEGTYMSSAWAILHGEITPYAYGYGHPPLAWIQIAAWVQMTGGLFTFGNAINSGRVLMLVYATGSALLVYLIIRRLLGSRGIALLTMVLFSLSPLSITFQRQVLLDNVATFWLLLSLYFLVIGNSRLLFIALSAISYGLSLLSKEVLLLYFPVMIYAVWLHTTRFQRLFALIAFIYSVSALGSTFILMAILKGELLPTGWFPWDQHQHLSLLSTYIGQVQRGQSQGSILVSFQAWTGVDYFFIMASIATTFINLIAGWWNRKYLLLSLFAISYSILFIRNGVTFPFYIIPLLPFCAINIALVINLIYRWLGKFLRLQLLSFLFIFLFLAGTLVYDAQHSQTIFSLNLTSPQTRALAWIHNNIPHNAVVVINSYYFADLHQSGGDGVGDGAIYPYAHIYWNVAFDPEIHDTLLKGDWNHIDYIVTDTPMLYDIQTLGGAMQIVNIAFQHSSLLADFRVYKNDLQNAIRIYKVNHTNPAPEVYQALPWHATADIPDFAHTRDIYSDRKTI
jgi:4-amino-4-deoxy-L-arabinose transferase-like glycosyltransferase